MLYMTNIRRITVLQSVAIPLSTNEEKHLFVLFCEEEAGI